MKNVFRKKQIKEAIKIALTVINVIKRIVVDFYKNKKA